MIVQETHHYRLVAYSLGAENAALLDGLVGIFLVPEADEPSAS